MPDYTVTYTLLDDNQPTAATRQKRFVGNFADYAAASSAEAALRADLDAATSAAIVRVQLTEDTVISALPDAGANVFEVASVTLPITAVKNANFQLPSPVTALQSPGNTIDTANAAWTALIDNFSAGWTVSDGENVDTTLGYGTGKLIFVRSGKKFS